MSRWQAGAQGAKVLALCVPPCVRRWCDAHGGSFGRGVGGLAAAWSKARCALRLHHYFCWDAECCGSVARRRLLRVLPEHAARTMARASHRGKNGGLERCDRDSRWTTGVATGMARPDVRAAGSEAAHSSASVQQHHAPTRTDTLLAAHGMWPTHNPPPCPKAGRPARPARSAPAGAHSTARSATGAAARRATAQAPGGSVPSALGRTHDVTPLSSL
jgi:hypothetical protein